MQSIQYTPSVPKCMSLGNMFRPGENGQMDLYAPSSNFESVRHLPQRLSPLPRPRHYMSSFAALPPALHLRPGTPPPPPRLRHLPSTPALLSHARGSSRPPRAQVVLCCRPLVETRCWSTAGRWWRRAGALLPPASGGELLPTCAQGLFLPMHRCCCRWSPRRWAGAALAGVLNFALLGSSPRPLLPLHPSKQFDDHKLDVIICLK